MTKTPSVDVVIPSIGRDSLHRAVQSALAQTHPARVIVVLDDPDRESQVRRILPDDHRIQLVITEGKVGGAAARNLGIDVATSPAIAFLDDDDWWDADSLERRLGTLGEFATSQTDYFVAGAFWHERPDGSSVVPRERPPYGDKAALASYVAKRADLRFGRTALQSSTMVLSANLARTVRWESALAKHQDWDFALRALATPSIEAGWLDAPTVHVEKDSLRSVSRRMDAGASLDFLERHPELRGRARSDFLAVHVLRASVVNRSRAWLREYVRASPGIPHLAAIVVAASGVRKRKGMA